MCSVSSSTTHIIIILTAVDFDVQSIYFYLYLRARFVVQCDHHHTHTHAAHAHSGGTALADNYIVWLENFRFSSFQVSQKNNVSTKSKPKSASETWSEFGRDSVKRSCSKANTSKCDLLWHVDDRVVLHVISPFAGQRKRRSARTIFG